LNQQGLLDGFDYDKNMKKTYNWTKDLEHMGHPNNYTKATPAGYKEEITWEDVDVHYTEEEKAKIRKEIYE
jgi:hypothetical protein